MPVPQGCIVDCESGEALYALEVDGKGRFVTSFESNLCLNISAKGEIMIRILKKPESNLWESSVKKVAQTYPTRRIPSLTPTVSGVQSTICSKSKINGTESTDELHLYHGDMSIDSLISVDVDKALEYLKVVEHFCKAKNMKTMCEIAGLDLDMLHHLAKLVTKSESARAVCMRLNDNAKPFQTFDTFPERLKRSQGAISKHVRLLT
ncbi:hypothetical protein FS749_003617 [Ceratobasidium sp. UAMH 11750]|nr:hypothetical protein FS749_003617 [Ceratobasidium sp. UAMH 11750]